MSTIVCSGRASWACRRLLAMLACAAAVPLLAQAPVARGDAAAPPAASATASAGVTGTGQAPQSTVPPAKASASATLEQCATAVTQAERAATFAGEMTVMPGTARMEMRIDIEEKIPGELEYRSVSAPQLSVWRASAPGVKIYTHLQQVTDLSAPALYRGAVRFRWLNAKGRVIRAEELHTPSCEQPAEPATDGSTTATATAPSGQSSSG